MTYDRVIIGAGMFGLYAAKMFGRMDQNTVVLEADSDAMLRASFVNQARVHNGYHYPRSMATAKQAGQYFGRFSEEFGDCINRSFTKVYATSTNFSWTNAAEFKAFCTAAGIPCEQVDHRKFFNDGVVDGVFLTEEYSFDADLIRTKMMRELSSMDNVQVLFSHRVDKITRKNSHFIVTACGEEYETDFVLNATYASANEILDMAGFDPLPTKYELCEIILGEPSDALKPYGITVMDGPFFSVMPFGCSDYHSLTSVCFTPHATSYDKLPTLKCQERSGECHPGCLQNCDLCNAKPKSAFHYMHGLMRKYLKSEYEFNYVRSHFALKLILKASEIDDSRPTVIKESSKDPAFVTVLSGKINTIYDLEEVLNG
ncbi:MAG: FAD-dependent oxidoreductase [Oscillospiraceae bacterium]|nr:FAD-dependent oxidoreductase [Oscillospiraceae bacterium]